MVIVDLENPAMCLLCKFCTIATVEMSDNSTKKMLHCKRLDCDNWVHKSNQDRPIRITEE